jgi:hypothetical protein
MSLRSTFKTDNTLETEGKVFEIGVNEHEAHKGSIQTVTLARMGKSNKAYLATMERLTAPHRAAIEHGSMPEKLSGRILRQAFAETVVKNWDNIPLSEFTGKEDDVEYVKFTPAKAIELFELLPELFDDWSEKARASSNFRAEALKVEAKN